MRDIAVALDMGNSGGKVIAACMQDGRLEILDERVIPNEFVEINGHLYWDTFFPALCTIHITCCHFCHYIPPTSLLFSTLFSKYIIANFLKNCKKIVTIV